MTDVAASAVPRPARTGGLYRAVWRWHFYAGLVVLPFLVLLAVTGAAYLFKDEINDVVQADLRRVEVGAATLPPSRIVAAALAAHAGTVASFLPPAAPDRAAQVVVRGADGVKDAVFVDPYTGAVKGTAWDGGASGSGAMAFVRTLHSLDAVGWWANRIVEAVAGWAILLVATGVFLWWPRGRDVGAFRVRRTRGRPLWRDIHAVTGIYTAAFIVFLALSGLPWSGVWGDGFYRLAHAAGLGIPDGYWEKGPVSAVPVGAALDRSPWIMGGQPMPASDPAGHHGHAATTNPPTGVPDGLDAVVSTVERAGIHPGWTLAMPDGPTGVFTATVYPDDVTQQRVIHVDRYSGAVLADMGLADLGALGAAAEWGVSLHMGQAFGLANQLVLMAACLGIVLLAVSGVVMWWRRRPAGGFGAPSVPADVRIPRGVLAIAVVAGVVFPLVGLSLLVVGAVELALHLRRRRRPPEAIARGDVAGR